VRRVRSRSVSVVAYVWVSFAICIVAVGGVMATTTATSFARDRKQASAGLEAAARRTGEWDADGVTQTNVVLEGLAAQEAISSLDPAQCKSAFQGLESIAEQGSIYLVAPDRSVVCSLLERRRPVVDLPDGTWFEDVQRTGESKFEDIVLETETGTPQIVMATPVASSRGTGVIVIAIDSAVPALEVPANSLPKTVLVELDKTRNIVVSTSPHAPVKVGVLPKSSWMRHGLKQTHTQRDPDGVVRMYEEVTVEGLGHVVYAGVARRVALQAATTERTHNTEIACAILVLVAYLGFVVQRRVARPIRHLQRSIHLAGEDGTVKASLGGPSEIAALADEFNATMVKRHDLEIDLAASVAKAEEASRMKSLFLANVSHEIRTPMNGVLGMISLLGDEELTAVQRDYIDTMSDSAAGLMTIINDLLDISKIEAGMVDIELISFDLRTCVRSAVSPWVPAARAKGVELSVAVDAGVAEYVNGDSNRVRQVLSNLVDNAVKFTAEGAVMVHVARGDGDVVRFEVTDTGIGISAKASEDLFEAFVQGDPSTTRRFGGTGLGLAVCKQLVTLMGGHIDASPRALTGGSIFFFELPLPAAEDRNKRVETPPPLPSLAGAGGHVLIAEDNLVNQKVAKALVEQLGFEVDIAGDGRQAVDMVSANSYVAILMDLQMPHMDGFEATAAIRNDLASTVPVYALSASVLAEDLARCEEVGMNGHLGKPIDRVALRDALEAAVSAAAL
jgi:signal transduction histidine kinase